jgi:lambda family phage portal protein
MASLLDRLRGLFQKPRKRAPGFAAADTSRLSASLATESEYINKTLRYQLRILRARSRQLCMNNAYGHKFAKMVVDNLCGPSPFILQAKVKTARGKLDDMANVRIEKEWKSWSRKGQCEITEQWSLSAFDRMVARIWAVDGEVVIRKYRGPEYGKHGFRLQIIDSDRLDDQKNKSLPGGGAIAMGIEYDAVQRPVAYHILKRKPSEWERGYTREHERIPANEILHLYLPEHAEQGRGVPWVYAAMMELVHLGAFEEAAVIAARVGAAQMGVIQSPDGGENLLGDSQDGKGNPQFEAEPGTFPMLPPGYEMTGWNPKYPDAAVGPFSKHILRGISAGLDVAYHNLANDLEAVNYSSAQIGEMGERDAWMSLQNCMIEHYKQPVFDEWEDMQILSSRLPFEFGNERYRDVRFQGRRWTPIDPAKHVKANVEAINARLKSRTRVVAETGEDFEDVVEELAAEEALLKQKKITPEKPTDTNPPKPAKPDNGDDDGESENETEGD